MPSTNSRYIKKRGIANYESRVSSQLEGLLADLLATPKRCRAQHDVIPKEPGAYLFSDANGKPVYVGQSRNIYERLAQHCRPSSPENAASFVFNIAKREAEHRSIDIAGFHRKALSERPDFKELFDDAKAHVALMPVQFIVEDHADLRTVFEVYATYAPPRQSFARPANRGPKRSSATFGRLAIAAELEGGLGRRRVIAQAEACWSSADRLRLARRW